MRTFTTRLIVFAAALVLGLPSVSNAIATLDAEILSLSGAGCGGARNIGNIVAGRAEGAGPGSKSVCASAGDTIFGRIFLQNDSTIATEAVTGYVYSMLFDEATGQPGSPGDTGNFQDELNLLAANELNSTVDGARVLTPGNQGITSTQESNGGQRGEALEFESLTAGKGLRSNSSPYLVGNFTMLVTANGVTDGRDIFVGFFTGNDGIAFQDLTKQSVIATIGLDVNSLVFIPEPGTAALLGLGLLGAVGLARRGTLRKR